jgi:hypothetical protein
MNVHYLHSQPLSPAAMELVQFDMDSIRQVVAGQHGVPPEIWLVDPLQYEKDGRLLRDSPTHRVIAYSAAGKVLYASDGCNTCSRPVQDFRNVPDIPQDLIERLAELVR